MGEVMERGKRKSARRMLLGWAVLTAATFFAITFGDLEEFELKFLIGLHGTVTTFASLSALVLFGLDGLASQIIPAWKGAA